MQVKITKIHPHAQIPKYQTSGSAGFDLASVEEIKIAPQEFKLIPTGLVIATPKNHVLLLMARSSLFKKKGLILANSVGVIDSDYQGPNDQIFIAVYNISDQECTISIGERIAQGLIMPVIQVEFQEGEINAKSRGGFGSTDNNQ